MYCSNCGAKILDDSIFCSECGMRIQQVKSMGTHVGEEDVEFAEMEVSGILHVDIEESTEELSAEGESLAGTTDEEEVQEKLIVEEDTLPDVMEEEKPRQRKKLRRHNNREKDTLLNMKDKKGWGVAGIALTSLLIITVVVICVLSAGKKAAYATEHFSVSAKMTDDGTAYIPLDEGKCIAINEEVKSAMLTKDRKRIVVLLEDGLLYITDINLSEKHKITDNAADILAIRNDGFIYRDKKDCDYRVFFSDYSELEIGEKNVSYRVADNSLSVLYATTQGEIYILAFDSAERVKVGTYDNEIDLEAISDNGQIAVWVTSKKGKYTIIMNVDEERYTLGEVSAKNNYTYVDFSDDQKMVAVHNTRNDCIWMKKGDEEPFEIKLGADIGSKEYYLFTNKGKMYNQKASDIASLYVLTESDNGGNIYNISIDGERERVLSKVQDFHIVNNAIIYMSVDGALYYAKLDGANITGETKIASDVDMFEVSTNGKYVYYMKDCGEYEGTLYGYKLGAEEPYKIASEVLCWNWTLFDIKLLISSINTAKNNQRSNI